ncbi:hypothetical protein NS506_04348 [Nocardia seriolae]|uniref:DUF2871 domain-containing protein n=1 Tax=Nocardia seriolae TaxID=37332 RepID=A0ABC8AWG9_9NOCA|nr:DUF2871 domain-containing protein [Nocardia seriolae]APA98396.1 hypothetical protein NS506_04348 [Nocardia seriolae]
MNLRFRTLGFFYREFTKAHDFSGISQLTATHTHVLALGTLFFLIVLALDKQFGLSDDKWFAAFFWTYNVGLLLTVSMMVTHGILTVLNHGVSPAVSGIAGLGHILLSIGFVFFFLCLRGPIMAAARQGE